MKRIIPRWLQHGVIFGLVLLLSKDFVIPCAEGFIQQQSAMGYRSRLVQPLPVSLQRLRLHGHQQTQVLQQLLHKDHDHNDHHHRAHDANDNANDDGIRRIQILISDTGGGHRASASALRDAFDILYPGKIECDIVDIYTAYGKVWPFNDYVAIYKFMAKYPITWALLYYYGASPLGEFLNRLALEFSCYDSFKECLRRQSGTSSKRADMVVSVHPLCQDLPLKILADLDSKGESKNPKKRTTPFCTVVTDLGSAHPTWFNPNVDKCFVPSDALYQAARGRGLQASQLEQYGLPIRKGFWNMGGSSGGNEPGKPVSDLEKADLRRKLGLDPSLPTVLVMGGGDGMGGLVPITKALGKKLGGTVSKSTKSFQSATTTTTTQMVVVCGKNEKAQSTLDRVEWGPGVGVVINGFVSNMDEWMKASDALVTKAGPGTIAEASICGLPCMMFAYLPGQEEGNPLFVQEAGFGTYSHEPSQIADTVSQWLASPESLRTMREAAWAAARPQATLNIARDIAAMVLPQQQKPSLLPKHQHHHAQLGQEPKEKTRRLPWRSSPPLVTRSFLLCISKTMP